MHDTSDNLFDSYLQEYMWKKQHKDNIFGNILYWISFYGTTANEGTRGSLVRMTQDVVYYSWAAFNTSIWRYLNQYELNFFWERIIQVQSFSIQSLYPWKKLTWRNERHLVIKLCTCIITLFFREDYHLGPPLWFNQWLGLGLADLPLNWNEKSGSDQQKIGTWGEKSGSWANRLQKEITHSKRRPFVVCVF